VNCHMFRFLSVPFFFLWPPCVADAVILFSSCGFYLLFSSPILSGRKLDVYHTSTRDVVSVRISNAGLKCAARGSLKNTGRKKSPKIPHLRTIAQHCRAISTQLRHVSTIGIKLLHSNIFSTCPNNMVNFSPLTTTEIGWRVWGTPANFKEFRVLASLLHRRR